LFPIQVFFIIASILYVIIIITTIFLTARVERWWKGMNIPLYLQARIDPGTEDI
jgi:hypothetical protein